MWISTELFIFNLREFFDNDLNIVGDTDTLDLDPRSFSTRLDEIEFESLNDNKNSKNDKNKNLNVTENKNFSFKDILAIIPISTDGLSFGEDNINFTNDVDFSRSYFGKVDIQKMNIKLIDDYGSLVNLNGANWSTILNTTHNNL